MSDMDIRQLWLSISDVALALAEVRDRYLKVRHREGRFMQLTGACERLNTVEEALFVYMEQKKARVMQGPDREIIILATAAVENGRVLVEVAESEVGLINFQQSDRDGKVASLKKAAANQTLSDEAHVQVVRALELADGVERMEKSNRLKTGRYSNA